ncbi:TIGR03668 family PPOX class F420-dependent oxidoreductase [Planosporangium sp. 12N6]|uniref:TIGR03668 family PPOX class F420-dependent oxidoreductase n=1 Tax=Planosporangium spinosum TaxID=3402278 RepID=UPI003CF3E670
MTDEEARRRFAAARVARLATADAEGRPHLVPMVFALAGERRTEGAVADSGTGTGATVYSAVDAKPKRSTSLRRLANIRANPRVAVLVDHYSDDWSALWWVRADGTGRVLDAGSPEGRDAIALLALRYPQYREKPPAGPVVAIDVERWSAWSAAGD